VHTPFQLVYGLHPLTPTKYFLFLKNNPMDHIPIHVLFNWIVNLEELEEPRQVIVETTTKRQSKLTNWAHQHYKQKSFAFNDHVLWFLKSKKTRTTMVWAICNLILSPQQHYFVGHGKNIWPTPHPCKYKQVQVLPILYSFLRMEIRDTRGGGGACDEQLE
jgi:hypothetical protein